MGQGIRKREELAARSPWAATSTRRSHEYPNQSPRSLRSLRLALQSLQPQVRAHASTPVPRAPPSQSARLAARLAGCSTDGTKSSKPAASKAAKKKAKQEQRSRWNRTAYLKLKGETADDMAAAQPAEATPSASAFARTKGGKLRPEGAAVRRAESRAAAPLAKDIVRAGGPEQQAAAIRLALDKEETKEAAKLLGVAGASEHRAAETIVKQISRMLPRATSTKKPRANMRADQAEWVEAVHVAIAPSPEKEATAAKTGSSRRAG
eukprot:5812258-Prymnesium_polylepis.1